MIKIEISGPTGSGKSAVGKIIIEALESKGLLVSFPNNSIECEFRNDGLNVEDIKDVYDSIEINEINIPISD